MDAAAAGLPSGAQMAVVSGDPGKAGMFKVQLKMPANYTVPPHHHPTDEIVRVHSGTLNYGMGDKVDKAAAGQLTDPKTHVTMAAGMNHWVFTTEPTVVEVSAMGPFQIIYANPQDDPRKK
jgi:quercetin dioxygenase-like cupin family protein